ncbi:hypothetical protein O1R50_20545 [Glycomyces luteolus]|uniref:Uncharacterized protein n=1 Tax=Glycomyces luteolus TaxID=2670330 RepID=A0A9X3PE30_9ACTN|nr:hypothetical protein [Glycomyces luteolus]MDA1362027.1 hypothetical protein [Glycomyces luteolus]
MRVPRLSLACGPNAALGGHVSLAMGGAIAAALIPALVTRPREAAPSAP